jgi:hypothetical protein
MTMSRPNSANMSHPVSTHSLIATNATGTDTDSNSVYSETTALLLPSIDGSQPSIAFEQSLSHDLQIPSKSTRLTSGFNYPSVLSAYGVSRENWLRFTYEITVSSELSPSQWRTVIGIGAGTMAIGGMILGIFGVIPAVLAARQKRVNQEIRNLAEAMGSTQPSSPYHSPEDLREGRKIEESEKLLSHKINHWNETYFNPRGIMIRVDMPYDLSMVDHDPYVVRQPSRFPVLSMFKEQDFPQTDKYKASQRCRIVIIRWDPKQEPMVSPTLTPGEESPYIPAIYE